MKFQRSSSSSTPWSLIRRFQYSIKALKYTTLILVITECLNYGLQNKSYHRISQRTLKQQKQQLVILAGPHKTGTSSMQTNFWKWSTNLTATPDIPKRGHNFNKNDVLPNWVWAVPPTIIQVESSDPHPWVWTPAKGFYPLLEALRHSKYKRPTRSLFQKYSFEDIIGMYSKYLRDVWHQGYSIIMGTEAMDLLVKDFDGARILHNLTSSHILPDAISPNQVSLVIVYRTPKSSHLVSIWHQNNVRRKDPGFYDWITTTGNELAALDALEMADLALKHTDWNVVLVDISGVKKKGWDITNLIACKVMNVDCTGKKIKSTIVDTDPIKTNVRENQRPPDVENYVLNRMENILRGFDCNYMHLFEHGSYAERLEILYPFNLLEIRKYCHGITNHAKSRAERKAEIVQIALAAGSNRKIPEQN